MTEVSVLLCNIQSHELTNFTLRPGMNFILAADNNVGKSTIFKVLTAVAKAPNINSSKVDALIRTDAGRAYAAFAYNDGERVVAWLERGATPGSAKMFFEHTDQSGITTRALKAPSSLLNALGIVVTDKGVVVNFNDADSVQLVSQVSSESDAVFTYVLLDEKVERVKQNIGLFARTLQTDEATTIAKYNTARDLMQGMQYHPEVDDFFDNLPLIEALATACDNCSSVLQIPKLRFNSQQEQELDTLMEVLSILSKVKEYSPKCEPSPELAPMVKVLGVLSGLNFDKLRKPFVTLDEEAYTDSFMRVLEKVYRAYKSADKIRDLNNKIAKSEAELKQIECEIKSQAQEVICPVKGKVWFTDEKCIHLGD